MIKKFYFENFKGFEKAEMSVENLTTVIGTNASGKTNAIEGMKILSELMTGRELSTILDGSKNNESNIRGGGKGCCRFNSTYFRLGCLVQYDKCYDLKYMVEIKVTDRILIRAESLHEITYGKGSKLLFKTKEPERESGDIRVAYNNRARGTNPEISCIRVSSVISQIPTKLPQDTEAGKRIAAYARYIMEQLKAILFLDPEPSAMRGYSRINDVDLKINAANLSSVLNKICKDKEEKEFLLNTMKHLPENEIVDITFAEGSLNDVILFLKEAYGSRQERIDATRLSDGTLRCLAIMAALLSEKERGMIVIEEIDNGIHPSRAKTVIHAVSSIARERNIDVLITTHNAVMLNALSKEDLMGVDIVYRDAENGASKFIPLISIDRMPQLLVNGKLGDVVTNGLILDFIKPDKKPADYTWLGV